MKIALSRGAFSCLGRRALAGLALLATVAPIALAEAPNCTGETVRRQVEAAGSAEPLASRDAVTALVALGECARRSGDAAAAVTAFEAALRKVQQLEGEPQTSTAAVQDRLAQALIAVGRGDEAVASWRAALATLEQVRGPAHPDTAAVASRLASALADGGAHAEAVALRERVVLIYERLGDAPLLATALSNMANSLDELGQDALALQRREQALRVLEAAPERDPAQRAVLLHELARTHLLANRSAQALATQRQAIAMLRTAPNAEPRHAVAMRAQLGECLIAAGQVSEARSELATLISEVKAKEGDDAPILSGLWRLAAKAEAQQGRPRGAMEMLHAAHRVALMTSNPERVWRVLADLAALHAQMGDRAAAIVIGKQAVQIVQAQRAEVASLQLAWQDSHARSFHALYQGLADQLIADGRIPEAQEVMDLLQRRELDEWVVRSGPAPRDVPLTGLEQRVFDRYATLRDEQVALGLEQRQLLQKSRMGTLSAAEKTRLEEIQTRLVPQMTDAFNRFLAAMQQELDSARSRPLRAGEPARDEEAPRLAQVGDQLRAAVTRLRALEPNARAVALQYVVSDDRLSIIVYTPDAPPLPRQVTVSRSDLGKRIQEARLMLSNRESDPKIFLPVLQQLHAWLIAPVAADLRAAGAQTLMLSMNDVLRYLPFAALHDGQRFLVQDYALASYNSAANTAFEAGSPRQWRVAAMGLTQAVDKLPALPAVKDELQGVVGAKGVTGNPYVDREFDRQRLLNNVTGDEYNALHVASHFEFVSGRAQQSRLYLGDKSRLTLADIVAQDWLFTNTSLLTLSACETGVGGGRDAYGQEIDGLGALVQRRGAQAAMVTMWKIADVETPRFMRGFYSALAQGQNKAQALRSTQLAYIERDGRIDGREIDRRARHPYFWAPFVMMGNWR